MPNKALLLGVTGGIGSGKSTVCQLFAILGIPVYNADDRAKWIVSNDLYVRKAIADFFGQEAFVNGVYNRSFIAAIVFQSPEKLQQLNAIIHPMVAKDFEKWVIDNQHKAPYLVKEAALLFDSGSADQLDYTVTVHAPDELRIKRVLQRDPQRSEEQIRNIISHQMPQDEMIKSASFLIDNSEKVLLIPQLVALNASILERC
jgi:dephospho-CoA kinase